MGTRARPSSTSVSSSSSPEAVSGSRSTRTRWARRPAAIVRAARLPRASPTRHCAEPGSPPRRAAPTGPTSTSRPSACRSPRSSASPCKPSSPADIRARVAEFPGGIRLLGAGDSPCVSWCGRRRRPRWAPFERGPVTALGEELSSGWVGRRRPSGINGQGGSIPRTLRTIRTGPSQGHGVSGSHDGVADAGPAAKPSEAVATAKTRGDASASWALLSDVCDDVRPIAKRRRRKLARR